MSQSGNMELWAAIGSATVVIISGGSWFLSHKLFNKQMEKVEDSKELQLD
jgi:hypothetical protein